MDFFGLLGNRIFGIVFKKEKLAIKVLLRADGSTGVRIQKYWNF